MSINISYQDVNYSETTPAFYGVPVQYWEIVIITVLVGLIIIAGLIGNSSILLAVSFSRKLQTATNMFVTNLAVADFLRSFTFIWYTVGVLALGREDRLTQQAYWFCAVTNFLILASTGTSTCNMAAIAFNRFIRITKQHLYRKIFTPGKIAIIIAMTWTLPAGIIAVGHATGNPFCDFSGRGLDTFRIIIWTDFVMTGLIILLSYIWIYIYVKRHFQTQKKNVPNTAINSSKDDEKSSSSEETGEDFSPSTLGRNNPPAMSTLSRDISSPPSKRTPDDRRNNELSKQQIKITKNLFLVVCAFFVCFMPYCILLISGRNATVAHIGVYVTLLPLFNSFINYVIYASNHPDFKIVLGHMMRRSYGDIPQPSKFLKFVLSKRK